MAPVSVTPSPAHVSRIGEIGEKHPSLEICARKHSVYVAQLDTFQVRNVVHPHYSTGSRHSAVKLPLDKQHTISCPFSSLRLSSPLLQLRAC